MRSGLLALVSGRSAVLLVALGGIVLGSPLPGCWSEDVERESERDTVRGERARRLRAERTREEFRKRWHAEYRREIARATTPHTPPSPPRAACEPWAEFRKQTQSLHHRATFTGNVQRYLSPTTAGMVVLDGRPHQSFRFSLRMHPAEEPDFGRRRARNELELTLRWTPLCADEEAQTHAAIVHLRVAKRPTAGRMGLQIRLPGRGLPAISPGEPVEILVDPTTPGLGEDRAHGGASSPRRPSAPEAVEAAGPAPGIWQVIDARVPDRPRLSRLELDTSAFGDRLRQIALVEVPCRNPKERCRFLTRTQKHRELPLALPDLLRLGAPLTKEEEARQVWAVVMALRYPHCATGEHRAAGHSHPCLRPMGPGPSEPCQFWLALNGFPTRLSIQTVQNGFEAGQVISCPGPKHRVLRVEVALARSGALRLRESDLTERAAELEAELRQVKR